MSNSAITRATPVALATRFKAFLSLQLAIALVVVAVPSRADEPTGSLFDNVAEALSERYFDKAFREKELPGLIEKFRSQAEQARTLNRQREVVHALLSQIPATHMALISKSSFRNMFAELRNESRPSFGFELVEHEGKQFARRVLEGGPAENAGLRRGDRIVTIDGVPASESARLDWRSDDAYLPDPAFRALLAEQDDRIRLEIERRPGQTLEIEIPAQSYSAWEAAKSSARVIEHAGRKIAYIHFWMIHLTGPNKLLTEKLQGEFAECDALLLDLRGRGGSGMMVPLILKVLRESNKPVVGLINSYTRSAKEVIAYELREQKIGRLVGEPTAGAVIPASFQDVGHDSYLMFPTFTLGKYTSRLELKGVKPDVFVKDAGPYSAGHDPLVEAGLREAVRFADDWAVAVAARETERAKEAKDAAALAELALPDVDTLLQKMIDARGGEAALRKYTAQTASGRIEFNDMLEGSLTTRRAAPNLLFTTVEIEGVGTFQQGLDGETAWRYDPQSGPVIMDGPEREDLMLHADFFGELNYRKNYPSIEIVGPARFADKNCIEVRMTTSLGRRETLYVDAQTYLTVGEQHTRLSPMGELPVVTTIEAYKSFGGILIATRVRSEIGEMQRQAITITDVRFDPQPPGAFDLPDNVRQIQGK